MFRRETFDRVGGYRPECEFWEDQDLVLRMAAETRILVIPEPLYEHRQWTKNTRVASDKGPGHCCDSSEYAWTVNPNGMPDAASASSGRSIDVIGA